MMKQFIAVIFLWLAGTGAVRAVNGVEFEYSVFQKNSDGQPVLLTTDTTQVIQGIRTQGFILAFSVELELLEVDTSRAAFSVHLVTFTRQANNYAQNFTVEYGLPAKLDGIKGRGDVEYLFELVPLATLDVDTSVCRYAHYNKDHFKFDPSAYIDIYYVPNTLGDFYWNTIKTILDQRYRLFMDINSFNMPGKYNVFVCPCPIYSVIWDNRFGMMVDPTRSNCFALYYRDMNTVYPFIVLEASIYRNYGWGPVFLAEGFANYLSFAIFDMKKMLKENPDLSVIPLLNTHTYLTADPMQADRIAGTFCRYLINQYKVDKFLEIYRQAHDLNLRKKIEEVIGRPIDELDQEWREYVDTVTIPIQQLLYFGERAEMMFNYPEMLTYYKTLIGKVTKHEDSLKALNLLTRANFFNGDYYAAVDDEALAVKLDTTNARNRMALAGYQMMLGQYDKARKNLDIAHRLDTLDNMIKFNLGIYYHALGQDDSAREMFNQIINSSSKDAQIESRVLLGSILQRSKDKLDRKKAEEYFSFVVGNLRQFMENRQLSSSLNFWLGAAYVGLGETGLAGNYLNIAKFVETRPFYEGYIELWLGKLADLKGERDKAKDHYRLVQVLPSAVYHQKEAKEYLEKPYKQ